MFAMHASRDMVVLATSPVQRMKPFFCNSCLVPESSVVSTELHELNYLKDKYSVILAGSLHAISSRVRWVFLDRACQSSIPGHE